jgi:hypothetical protein
MGKKNMLKIAVQVAAEIKMGIDPGSASFINPASRCDHHNAPK